MAMRRLCVVLALATLALGQNRQSNAPKGPANGYVPDATTAVKVAEAVLIPVYGEKRIEAERPFHATLEGDVYCPDGTASTPTHTCKGGTAVVKLSKADARILFMMHYK